MALREQDLAVAELLAPGRCARWRELLAKGSETARTKALSTLYHGPVVDERFAPRVPAANADVEFA